MKRIRWGFVLLAFAVLLAGSIVYGAWVFNSIDREIDSWQVLAQTASKPTTMYEYMSKVKVGLEKWNMTSGHSYWPATPTNDMAQKYQAVTDVISELQKMKDGSWNQADLNGIANRIKAINLQTSDYWSWHQGWWLFPSQFLLFVAVFASLSAWLWFSGPFSSKS